jgi:hypothetical protein
MPLLPFVQRAAWIWSAEATHAVPAPGEASPSHYQVRRFRRRFTAAAGDRLTVHVTGDSRYLFYCNGKLVARGPAKGDVNHHFYETCDLTPHLVAGENVLAALVLDMSRVAHRPHFLGAPCSVMTYAGGFLLEGEIVRAGSEPERLDTGRPGWKVAVDRAHRWQNDNTKFEGYLGYFEHRVDAELPAGWAEPAFADEAWAEATVLYEAERFENRRDPTSPYGLVPRIIPALEEGERQSFADAFAPGGGELDDSWAAWREGRGRVTVPPRTTVSVILDAGELTTAYPQVAVRGGAGSQVRLTYAEALRLPWDTAEAKLLGRQQSLANLASHFADEGTGWTFDRRGLITGWSDRWEPAGGESVFEPLHWRAFRYVGLAITTGDEALDLTGVGHRFCAYPYAVQAEFSSSDPRLDAVFRAGVRTMRLCSHETFEDCPHYEQMQYAGDTMITSKLGMLTSGDARLSRQAVLHFDWSRLSDGLTQARYPSRLVQIIPSWSLHWITCVRDLAMVGGDLATAGEVWPGIRSVLDWFRRHGDADGLPAKLPYWNVTDWCPWWPRGVVPGAADGPVCILGAQFITALDETAELARLLGRDEEAAALTREADGLRAALHRRFWSEEEGLYFDRPGGPEVSQYGNAWAIACGAADAATRARIMARFPSDEKLAPGSFFCWHLVFRALRRAGEYDRMPEFLGPWHESVEAGLDTFVEENSYWRSLCHAWSAHPVVECLQGILGVTPAAPGYAAIRVAPQRCGLTQAQGRVCTPRGLVEVAWRQDEAGMHVEGTGPADTPLTLVAPDGREHHFTGGAFTGFFNHEWTRIDTNGAT